MSNGTWEAHLDKANSTRFARSTIKRELRNCVDKHASLRLCAQHIADPVDELAAMTAFDLVAACHRSGTRVALKVLNAAKVGANVKIGHPDQSESGFLSARQRLDLVAALNVGPVLSGTRRRPKPVSTVLAVAVASIETRALTVAPVPEPDETGPSLSKWCPTCGEWALPMQNGTCGFCDTRIVDAA